ncbi:MAG: serine/threonine protein phosphatase [Ruminococcus sp.]|nr:serine/threonine protein phosphatase [Ruminococcus sp.]
MKLFSAKNKSKADATVQTSLSKANTHPFLNIENYSPYQKKQYELYKSLREAVPIIDAAISKIIRLIGTFDIECEDKTAQSSLRHFLDNVQVNSGSYGIFQFIYSYFDQLLTYGTAVGEIVLSKDMSKVQALYNASLNDVKLEMGDSALDLKILAKNADMGFSEVKYPEFVCVSLLNPEQGSVEGTSILKGLPFVSSVLLKIFNTIGVNFERVGNVRFAVTYNPKDSQNFNTKQRVQEIASQWSKAMRDKTQVCDFVSVGDVSVKVIGADNQVLSCDIEIRHLLEQIISKLSIPPFLLGFSWSSTERMSSQQADILTSELEYYRTLLNPVISKICRYYLRLEGFSDEFTINWSDITLQDEVELSKARLQNAQAMQIESTLSEVKQ